MEIVCLRDHRGCDARSIKSFPFEHSAAPEPAILRSLPLARDLIGGYRRGEGVKMRNVF